jgi:AAA family ATP:ADP antiporter
VAREEYKAKNVIDTAVYRGGDMLSSWLVAALRSLGLGLPALSFAAVPLALAWLATSIGLGRRDEAARDRA